MEKRVELCVDGGERFGRIARQRRQIAVLETAADLDDMLWQAAALDHAIYTVREPFASNSRLNISISITP